MKKSTIISAVAVLGLIIGGANFASAQMGFHGDSSGMGYNQTMTSLSPEKQAEYDKLHNAYMDKTRPLQRELREKRLELDVLSNNQQTSPAQLSALVKEVNDLRAQLQDSSMAFMKDAEEKFGIDYSMHRGMKGQGFGHMGNQGYGHKGSSCAM